MFETKDFHKNVFIGGNIIFETDKEVSFIDIVAYSTFAKAKCYKTIDSDKEKKENGVKIQYVSNETIFEDNVIYHVKGEVTSYGYERKLPNPYNCIYTYNNNVLDMRSIIESGINKVDPLSETDISLNLVYRTLYSISSVNRMLYQAILTNYELFMMDIIITCILRFENINEICLKQEIFLDKKLDEVIYKIRGMHYNRFAYVSEKLFSPLFGITLSNYSDLEKAFKKRDNFAHRYNTTKYGEALVVEDNELKDLVLNVNEFVYELFNKVKRTVY